MTLSGRSGSGRVARNRSGGATRSTKPPRSPALLAKDPSATGHLTKRDAVAATLRNEISRGVIAPGTRLRQMAVAARLGVSPTPVREAFSELTREGYLASDPFRGVTVTAGAVDPAAVADAYQIRGMLEKIAVRRAARKVKPQMIRRLEHAERDARAADRAGNADSWQLANWRFHEGLVAMAESPLLDQVMGIVLRRSLFFPTLFGPRIHREHDAIVAALRSGKGAVAFALVAKHAQANVAAAKVRPDVRELPKSSSPNSITKRRRKAAARPSGGR